MTQLGPVVFWSASKFKEFLPSHFCPSFQEYIEVVSQTKIGGNEQEKLLINPISSSLKNATCVLISEDIPPDIRKFLFIDSLYLLYFACTFRSLYYGQEIPSFNPFCKMIPALEEFIKDKPNWENLCIHENEQEEPIYLHIIDPEICQGLGKALEAIYLPSNSEEQELIQAYKRLVRSIRYLVDRFIQRFVNLLGKGLHFSKEIFEPEDIVFLASSFESLFNIDNSQEAAADFKHKLRPLLHLKYSRPVEIFWKWVDEFYKVKHRAIQGDFFLDLLFRLNPNFEVSHIILGIKLFVYSVYYQLFTYQLLRSKHTDPYTPPDFKWIHPEEVLLFFWTEESVLEKISLFIKQYKQAPLKEELLADMHLLTTLFVSLYDRYYLSKQMKRGEIRFIPSPLSSLIGEINYILKEIKEMQNQDPQSSFLQFIHPYFIEVLEDRLQERRLI